MGEDNKVIEAQRACRRSTNDLLATCARLRDELSAAADAIIAQYKSRSREVGTKRRKTGKFNPVPWPEKRETSPGTYRLYWKLITPKPGGGQYSYTSEQIKREKSKTPYPAKKLGRYTDELNHELVLQTERELRRVERLMETVGQVGVAVREATGDSDE